MMLALGDPVHVDWHTGHEPEPATVVGVTDATVWLRFPGESRDRAFTAHNRGRGLYRSTLGQIVRIDRMALAKS